MSEPWIQDAVLILTLGAIIWYTLETRRLRKLMEQEREEARVLSEPFFEFPERDTSLPNVFSAVVLNRGGTVHSVRVTVEADVNVQPLYPHFLLPEAVARFRYTTKGSEMVLPEKVKFHILYFTRLNRPGKQSYEVDRLGHIETLHTRDTPLAF